MRYWLLKSEPETYSIDDLAREGRTLWDGVRNYQARNNLASMKVGDLCYFYHSVKDPGIVGICRVSAEARPDPSQFDPSSRYYDPESDPQRPRWVAPEVEFVEKFPRPLSLARLKATPGLEAMEVNRKGSRLSVQPVRPEEWDLILRLARS
ncbi:MAG TPA: EVE domain-containing protein [Candidatus Nitrosotenuis sp.]|nr:EVE domain-containing protein [Candidatus Nitrosotenuis sp.]